ncbi:ABC transporter permease [Actinomadura yumaensis]|uniref:ABC transporter permease n=1 Tax=Actinomadura yumaensis TaxID=111807 RepID=UPI0036236779
MSGGPEADGTGTDTSLNGSGGEHMGTTAPPGGEASARTFAPASASGAAVGGEGDGRGGGSPGYDVRRTLPLRVEVVRQFRRRRTLIAFGILLVLPWVLVGAFQIGGDPGREGVPGLVDVATSSAMNFALFALFVSTGFLLVVAVALFCGDTVASEAGWSSLRYLLASPVPRARLLRQKLAVAVAYAVAAVLSLPLMSLLAGTVAFGWGTSSCRRAGRSRSAPRSAGWGSSSRTRCCPSSWSRRSRSCCR